MTKLGGSIRWVPMRIRKRRQEMRYSSPKSGCDSPADAAESDLVDTLTKEEDPFTAGDSKRGGRKFCCFFIGKGSRCPQTISLLIQQFLPDKVRI